MSKLTIKYFEKYTMVLETTNTTKEIKEYANSIMQEYVNQYNPARLASMQKNY